MTAVWYGPATISVRDFGGVVTGLPCSGIITGLFNRLDAVHAKPHSGLDIASSGPVYALAPGRVRLIGRPWDGSGSMGHTFGYCVILEHGEGRLTLYGHLRDLPLVVLGQMVTRGQQLGIAGQSGQATGDHLHLGVSTLANPLFNKDEDGGVSRLLDPLDFILAAEPPTTVVYPVPDVVFVPEGWAAVGGAPWEHYYPMRAKMVRGIGAIQLIRDGRTADGWERFHLIVPDYEE